MNHNDKMSRASAIMSRCFDTMDAKGRDYSGTEDAMSNFADFGSMGIIVRMGDKWHRLKNLTKCGTHSVDESVQDTIRDLINYGILALIQMEIEEDERVQKTR